MDAPAAGLYALAFHSASGGPSRITLLQLAPGEDPRAAADVRRRAEARRVGDPGLSAGLAGPRAPGRSLRIAALQAEQAARIGRALEGPGRVTAFGDLGPYCFILGRSTAEIRAFCRAVLGPLADDPQHDELRTLEVFLRHHGSLNAVARTLFLHRNTVRQRLKRISALTGADLEDAGQRVQLYLAVLGQQALTQLAS